MHRASAVGVLALVLVASTACTSASDPAPKRRTVFSVIPGSIGAAPTLNASVGPAGSSARSTWVRDAQRFLAELRGGTAADLAKAGATMAVPAADLARAGRAVRTEATTAYRGWSVSVGGSSDDLVVVGNVQPVPSATMPSGSVWSCTFHFDVRDARAVPTMVRLAFCIGFGADDLPNGQTLFRLPVR